MVIITSGCTLSSCLYQSRSVRYYNRLMTVVHKLHGLPLCRAASNEGVALLQIKSLASSKRYEKL